MCTSAVELEPALRSPPEMVTLLVTEPASGMAASVPLVPEQLGAGVVPPVPVKRSRFGEPVPGLPTAPVVALFTIVSRTCCGLNDVLPARISAAAPATCGVAIDVPLIVFVAESLEFQEDVMPTPGAKMSRQVPMLEKEAFASFCWVAPTVIAAGTRAGDWVQAFSGRPSASPLPAAMA